ncbi:hypothetical protein [Kitasatospora sp. NPDC001175]|uniref:hypothetical protein n=1 Tax=Kitasatospora sp. NPDC001175 TaxID=3157103 RepID=UPI003D066DD7
MKTSSSLGAPISPSAAQTSPTNDAAPSWSGVPAPPEALAAYSAMWEDIMAVAQTSAYTDPRIAKHMMGKPLTFWTEQLAKDQSKGKVSKGLLTSKPVVTSVSPQDSPNRVEVTDCLDSSHWQHFTVDGQLAADAGGGRHRSAAAITKRWDGSWVVSEQLIGEVGTC